MRLLCYLLIILLPSLSISATKTKKIIEEVFVAADIVEYNSQENYIYAKGNIKIKFNNYTLTSDTLVYDIENDQLWANGRVKIQDQNKTITLGESAIFKDQLKIGVIKDFILKFNDNSIIVSKLAKRIDKNHISLHMTTFTPCQIPCSGNPIWQISSKETLIDYEEEKIIYKNIFIEVYGIPIFFSPYFSHPLPSAQAKSGILIPKIEKDSFSLPFYLRVKPNLDFTLTPRISKNYVITELETRHRTSMGYYQIIASYGYVPYKERKKNSGFVSSFGDFYKDNYKYGFNINQTSDKAFLKNYYERYDSYLDSKMYFTNIYGLNYINIEGFHFQGLRSDNLSVADPWIFPKIRTKNVINLNDEENSYLTIKDDFLIYKEPNPKLIFKNSLDLSLTHNMLLSNGQLITLIARTIGDLYSYKNFFIKADKNFKSYYRNIPEVQAIWRYPFIKSISSISSAIIEPIFSLTLGRKANDNDKRFKLIDSSRIEITADNLFTSNHYSGTDYHEFGTRLSYGVNAAFLSLQNYYTLFIGQYFHEHNINSNDKKSNIGKLAANFGENLEFFYKYRKGKNFKSIKDELGSNILIKNLQLTFNFIKLTNLKKYYSEENYYLTKNNATQIQYIINYQLNSNWLISHDMRLDLIKGRIKPISKTIRVTYFKDCVKISAKLYDNYTSDRIRGIKEVHSKTVTFGLKVLNM